MLLRREPGATLRRIRSVARLRRRTWLTKRADEARRSEGVFACGEAAIYPHPLLAPARELVVELVELAWQGDLTVAIAVHPFRARKRSVNRHRDARILTGP